MSAASYMRIFNHEFSEGADAWHGTVSITYNIKDCAPKCVAVVKYDIDGLGKNIIFNVVDHGRKVRNTRADAERVGYVLESARRWYYITFGIAALE